MVVAAASQPTAKEGLAIPAPRRDPFAVDKTEARAIALKEISALGTRPWAELRDCYLRNPETVEVDGPSGTRYQVKTHAVWDSKKDGDLRIFVEVDDGGWRAFVPLSESFIISPDGSFVGE